MMAILEILILFTVTNKTIGVFHKPFPYPLYQNRTSSLRKVLLSIYFSLYFKLEEIICIIIYTIKEFQDAYQICVEFFDKINLEVHL